MKRYTPDFPAMMRLCEIHFAQYYAVYCRERMKSEKVRFIM